MKSTRFKRGLGVYAMGFLCTSIATYARYSERSVPKSELALQSGCVGTIWPITVVVEAYARLAPRFRAAQQLDDAWLTRV